MAGDLSMPESFATKEEMYAYIHTNLKLHLEALDDIHKKFDHQLNLTTALANAASLIYYAMNSFDVQNKGTNKTGDEEDTSVLPPQPLLHKAIVNWVGFYLIADAQYMVLGPFQGKVACTRIKIGKGVCGTAVLLGKTQCVPNVHEFPGHIACDCGSESEIVVPIRDNNGRIVGVLDIDSTVLNRFDQTDVMRLTDIAVLLSQHVTFPNVAEQRSKNMEPLDGRVSAAAAMTAAGAVKAQIPIATAHIVRNPVVATVPAVVGGGSAASVVAKSLGDWHVECRRLDRIICAAEIERWESEHNIACIPEIVFPMNAVEMRFTNTKTGVVTVLKVDAESYFKNATSFYKTRAKSSDEQVTDTSGTPDETYDTLLEQQSFLKIPVADSWKNTKFGKFDPNIDWASRGNYICDITQQTADGQPFVASEASPLARFRPSSTAKVNYDLLKRRDLDILAYDSFDLFEDDLHDTGISKASVKMRVMPLCIFILVRHVVRVDQAAAVVRDVRLYAELDSVAGVAGIVGKTPSSPCVVAEVMYKHMMFPESPLGVSPGTPQQQTRQVEAQDKSHLRISLDALVEQMEPSGAPKNYVLSL